MSTITPSSKSSKPEGNKAQEAMNTIQNILIQLGVPKAQSVVINDYIFSLRITAALDQFVQNLFTIYQLKHSINKKSNKHNNNDLVINDLETFRGDYLHLTGLTDEDKQAISDYENKFKHKIPNSLMQAWTFARAFNGNKLFECANETCNSCSWQKKNEKENSFCASHGLFADPLTALVNREYCQDFDYAVVEAQDEFGWIFISKGQVFQDNEVQQFFFLDPKSGCMVSLMIDDHGDYISSGLEINSYFRSFYTYLLVFTYISRSTY